MKKIIIIVLISITLLTIGTQNETITIPKESIRFRIIANSNSTRDQVTKMSLATDLYPTLMSATQGSTTIAEARENIKATENDLKPIIEKYSSNYQINYGNNYFPEKQYKGVTYDAGNYESLVVELGDASGDNWWCVLFPPLCLLEAEENNTDEVEYKFFVSEIIEKYVK